MECYALREWIAPELIIETGSSEFGKTAGRLGVDNNQLKPIAGDSFAKIEGKLYIFSLCSKQPNTWRPSSVFDIVQGGCHCQGPNFRGDSNLDFDQGGQSEELTRSPRSKKSGTDKQRPDHLKKNSPIKKKNEKDNNFCLL